MIRSTAPRDIRMHELKRMIEAISNALVTGPLSDEERRRLKDRRCVYEEELFHMREGDPR